MILASHDNQMGSRCVYHWRELSGKCTYTFRNHNFIMGKVQINEWNTDFEAIEMLIPEGVVIWYLWGNGLAPHYSHPRLKNVINVIFFKGHHQSFKTYNN